MKPELIAPAGSLKKLKYAFEYGADAVYLGLPDFSLRARVNEFNLTRLKSGIKYAHDRNKKVYVTVNIFAHDKHLRRLEKFVKEVNRKTGKQKNSGTPDAFVISDPGVLRIVKKLCPKIPIHLSTQANTTNWQAAKFWYEQGVSRIILAREVTLKEMAVIHKRVPKLELETFVHGAMCMAYSGRCILSKWMTGRSANLGDCAHACRWQFQGVKYQGPRYKYQERTKNQISNSKHPPKADPPMAGIQNLAFFEEAQRPGEIIPVEEDEHGTYIFNSKDLCLIDHLEDLQKAGVKYFKIEGRAKSIYYLASVVKSYRQAIDKGKLSKNDCRKFKEEFVKIANREYHTGFLFGKDKFEHLLERQHVLGDYMLVGEVLERKTGKQVNRLTGKQVNRQTVDNEVLVRVHNALYEGDEVEAIVPGGDNVKFVVKGMRDVKSNEQIKEAHGGAEQRVVLDCKYELPGYTVLRKNVGDKM